MTTTIHQNNQVFTETYPQAPYMGNPPAGLVRPRQ